MVLEAELCIMTSVNEKLLIDRWPLVLAASNIVPARKPNPSMWQLLPSAVYLPVCWKWQVILLFHLWPYHVYMTFLFGSKDVIWNSDLNGDSRSLHAPWGTSTAFFILNIKFLLFHTKTAKIRVIFKHMILLFWVFSAVSNWKKSQSVARQGLFI